MSIHQIIAVGVAVFIAVYSISKYQKINNSYSQERHAIKSDSVFAFVYRYLQLSTLIFTLLGYSFRPAWLLLVHDSTLLLYSGLFLALISIFLFRQSLMALGAQYSPCYDLRGPTSIIKTGIYRYIRHPIYTANFVLLLGFFLSTGSLLILLNFLILFFFYYRSAVSEEKDLLQRFSEYSKYVEESGMFIPKIFKN